MVVMSTSREHLMAPHMKRAAEILADGQWHNRDVVIEEMIKLIPPGQAIRHSEEVRLRKRQARIAAGLPVRDTPQRATDRSTTFLVRTGARSLAMRFLNASRRIEAERREDGTTWVRMREPAKYSRQPKTT